METHDDDPLFNEANESYQTNLKLLEQVKAASSIVALDINGVSVKSGYFFYLYMKVFRSVAAAGGSSQISRGQALRKILRKVFQKNTFPTGSNGVLRLDFSADLYEGVGGFWNKNIDISGTSIVICGSKIPAFVSQDHPRIDQSFDIAAALSFRTYRWGIQILDALNAAGLEISRRKFWLHHLVYCSRLFGFANLFNKIFSCNSFEQVHFCRFSDVNMQGLLLAARKHDVQAIEYQHGVISNLHPAVVLLDSSAVATTPDVLKIASPIYENISYGDAAVELASPLNTSRAIRAESAGTGVLIAMQPRFADDAVSLALRMAADFPKIGFTLRSHPRAQPKLREIAAIEEFKNLALERAEQVESARSLLDRDGLITGSSTMGLSAAASGIPTLFLHKEGFEQAKQLLGLASANFAYSETYADIRSWLLSIQPQ